MCRQGGQLAALIWRILADVTFVFAPRRNNLVLFFPLCEEGNFAFCLAFVFRCSYFKPLRRVSLSLAQCLFFFFLNPGRDACKKSTSFTGQCVCVCVFVCVCVCVCVCVK